MPLTVDAWRDLSDDRQTSSFVEYLDAYWLATMRGEVFTESAYTGEDEIESRFARCLGVYDGSMASSGSGSMPPKSVREFSEAMQAALR